MSSPLEAVEEAGGFLLLDSLETSDLWTVAAASAPLDDDDDERCLTDYQKKQNKTLTYMNPHVIYKVKFTINMQPSTENCYYIAVKVILLSNTFNLENITMSKVLHKPIPDYKNLHRVKHKACTIS